MEVGACLGSDEAWRVSSQHVSYRAVVLFLVKEDNNDPSWPVTGPVREQASKDTSGPYKAQVWMCMKRT